MRKFYTILFLLVSIATFSQVEANKRCTFDAYGMFRGDEILEMEYKTGNFYMDSATGVMHLNIEGLMDTVELQATDVYIYPSYLTFETTSGMTLTYSPLLKVLFLEIGGGSRLILTDTSVQDPEVLPFGKEELSNKVRY